MSDDTPRTFSRFYAQLRRQTGVDVRTDTGEHPRTDTGEHTRTDTGEHTRTDDEEREPLGFPKRITPGHPFDAEL